MCHARRHHDMSFHLQTCNQFRTRARAHTHTLSLSLSQRATSFAQPRAQLKQNAPGYKVCSRERDAARIHQHTPLVLTRQVVDKSVTPALVHAEGRIHRRRAPVGGHLKVSELLHKSCVGRDSWPCGLDLSEGVAETVACGRECVREEVCVRVCVCVCVCVSVCVCA